jgi:hypothetical protein
MPGWNESLTWWLAAVSVVSFLGSLLLVPFIAVRIPRDYFVEPRRRVDAWGSRNVIVRAIVVTLKNLLGFVLILAGLAMLVLPGQGLLTMLIGLMAMNFPGKYRLERFLVSRGPVLRSINWIRRRCGVAPLVLGSREDGR